MARFQLGRLEVEARPVHDDGPVDTTYGRVVVNWGDWLVTWQGKVELVASDAFLAIAVALDDEARQLMDGERAE